MTWRSCGRVAATISIRAKFPSSDSTWLKAIIPVRLPDSHLLRDRREHGALRIVPGAGADHRHDRIDAGVHTARIDAMLGERGTGKNKQAHHGHNSPSDVHGLQPLSGMLAASKRLHRKYFNK
jgi:hypothetical protein